MEFKENTDFDLIGLGERTTCVLRWNMAAAL